eukprot:406128-Rhodomonas_salina.2
MEIRCQVMQRTRECDCGYSRALFGASETEGCHPGGRGLENLILSLSETWIYSQNITRCHGSPLC